MQCHGPRDPERTGSRWASDPPGTQPPGPWAFCAGSARYPTPWDLRPKDPGPREPSCRSARAPTPADRRAHLNDGGDRNPALMEELIS